MKTNREVEWTNEDETKSSLGHLYEHCFRLNLHIGTGYYYACASAILKTDTAFTTIGDFVDALFEDNDEQTFMFIQASGNRINANTEDIDSVFSCARAVKSNRSIAFDIGSSSSNMWISGSVISAATVISYTPRKIL